MAIDRAPWNALVDDDGSNLVGSVWNKAAIKTVLLDPIDGITWQSVAFSAANFVANAGAWTVAAGHVSEQKYIITGKAVDVLIVINGASVTGAPTNLAVTGWPFTMATNAAAMGLCSGAVGGWGPVLAGGNGSGINFNRLDFAGFPVASGTFALFLTARYRLA